MRRWFYSPLRTPVGNIACLLAVGPAGYGWWSYSGPFRWLAELQLRLFGQYEVVLTFALAMIVIGFALMVVLAPLARAGCFGRSLQMTRDEARRRGVEWEAWMRAQGGVVYLTIIAALALVAGTIMWRHEQQLKSLSRLSAADAERGVSPTSGWIEVTGVPRPDLMFEYELGRDKRFCVPLVSSAWTFGQPIAVVVDGESSDKWRVVRQGPATDQPVVLRAVRSISGMSGMAREEYRRAGIIDHDVLALNFSRKPGDLMIWSWIGLIAGAVGLLASLVLWVIVVRKHSATRERTNPFAHPV